MKDVIAMETWDDVSSTMTLDNAHLYVLLILGCGKTSNSSRLGLHMILLCGIKVHPGSMLISRRLGQQSNFSLASDKKISNITPKPKPNPI